MLGLFVMLLVALAPTALFQLEAAPTICFFDRRLFSLVTSDTSQDPFGMDFSELRTWGEFQGVIISEALLIIGLISRCFKLLQPLSCFANKRLRNPLSVFGRRILTTLARKVETGGGQETPMHLLLHAPLWFGLVVFLSLRILVDLWTSMLTEVRETSSLGF